MIGEDFLSNVFKQKEILDSLALEKLDLFHSIEVSFPECS